MGKGSLWRKGTDFRKYYESDYWKERDKRVNGPIVKCVLCHENIESCKCVKKPIKKKK